MALANLVFAACQWGVLVVLARLGGPAQVGEFTLAMAIVSPVLIFSQFSLRAVLATDTGGDARPFVEYLHTRATTTVVAWLALLALVPLLGYGTRVFTLVALLGLAKAAEAMSDIYYGLGQKHERLDINARSLILRGLAGSGAFALGAWWSGDVVVACALYAVCWAGVWLLHDTRATRALRVQDGAPAHGRTALAAQGDIVRHAFPLGLVLTLATVNTNIPRVVLERTHGLEALGYYGAVSQVIIAGLIVITAIGQPALPRLAGWLRDGDFPAVVTLMSRLGALTLALALAGVAATWLIGEWVLGLLYGPRFATQGALFLALASAAVPLYLGHIAGFAATACRTFVPYAVCYGVSTTLTLIAAVWLVPRFGTLGAAATIAVTGAANLATALVVVSRFRRRHVVPA